ncbi:unnamed protein product [Chrysoparadoxa australica]
MPPLLMRMEEDPLAKQQRRQTKWKELHRLHHVLQEKPYRYRAFEKAMERFTPGAGYRVELRIFVSCLMAEYSFERKLRMDQHLESLFECFLGDEEADTIDYREVICCLDILQLHRMVRESSLKLLFRFIQKFSGAGTTIARHQLLRVMKLPAITEDDMFQTAGRMDAELLQAAPGLGLKPGFKKVDFALMSEIMENNPAILEAYRDQLWQCLPQEWRLAVLYDLEELRFRRFGLAMSTKKDITAVNVFAKGLKKRYFRYWLGYHDEEHAIREQHRKMNYQRQKAATRIWLKWAKRSSVFRERRLEVNARFRKKVLSRFFRRIRSLAGVNARIKACTRGATKEGKMLMLGVGLVKGIMRRHQVKAAIRVWFDTVSQMTAWDFAVKFSDEKLTRHAWNAFRGTLQDAIAARKEEEIAQERVDAIQAAIEESERNAQMLKEAAEKAEKKRKADAKQAYMEKRARERAKEREERERENQERQEAILKQQHYARRQRIQREKATLQHEFEQLWKGRTEEIVRESTNRMRSWIASDALEAKYALEKELKVVKRKFYAAPSPETVLLEKALKDPANVIFAHIGARLFQKDMSLEAFFQQYDKEGDGYLTYSEFKYMVEALELRMSAELLRAAIKSIDMDGGGFVDFPELELAMQRHEQVCGLAGSPWKMYVNPIHAIMTFHNLETDEQIWDYKATDVDLLRVVKDNMIGVEAMKEREKAKKMREEAWQSHLEDEAAKVLQRMYHVWHGRCQRAQVRWKWESKAKKAALAADAAAATTMQCWWRTLRAQWRTLGVLLITTQKLFDPGSGALYFLNHNTQAASWRPPYLLKRLRGEDADLDDPLEWQMIVRQNGQYYVNTLNGEMQDDRPPGLIQCQGCDLQVAIRKCHEEGRLLCFTCYKREHSQQPDAWRHSFSPLQLHRCQICAMRTCSKVCYECKEGEEMQLCDSCWDRVHAFGAKAKHTETKLSDKLTEKQPGNGRDDNNASGEPEHLLGEDAIADLDAELRQGGQGLHQTQHFYV